MKLFSKLRKRWWVVLIILLALSVPATLRLVGPGFYEPHDLHHFADIYQMFRALVSGQIPPRWGPDFLYNFGYPLFNFYYVIPFYLGAGFFALTGSLQWAFKLVFVASVLISVTGMYLLIREFAGRFAAVVGSILFLYTPYRAVQIYVRGAMGEAFSLALTPLIAYLLIKIVKSPGKLKLIGLGGIFGAIFVLSHNYMWVLSMSWVIILALVFVERKNVGHSLMSLLFSGILMFGVSAYWWLPAIIEQNLVASQTPFPLINHFPFIKQLIIPSWGYGSSIQGPYDGLSFQIGVTNLVTVFGIGVLLIFFRKLFKEKKLLYVSIWGVTSFLIMFFMMNIRSYPIWKILPFHDFIQFPWRLLSFTTFFTAILAGVLVEVLKGKLKMIVGIFVIVLSMGLTVNYFRPSSVFFKTDNEYLSRFFANRTIQGTKNMVSKEYMQYSEDYLLLPKTDEIKPNILPPAKITSDTAKISNIKEISAVSFSAEVESSKNSTLSFNSLYFPGWYGTVDSRPVDLSVGKPYGQIEIVVPAGSHKVAFRWKETPLRKTADIISLASLLICATILVWKKERESI